MNYKNLYIQRLLNKYASLNNLNKGRYLQEDGLWGKKSISTLIKFQLDVQLQPTGDPDKITYIFLTRAINVNCWLHKDVNCWADGNGTRGQKTYPKDKKNFIVLHHTVSGGSPFAVKRYFQDKGFGTQFVLGSKGDFVQCYDDYNYWGWHLNVNAAKGTISKTQEKLLAQQSVAVEICNYGALTLDSKGFKTTYGNSVEESKIIDYKAIYGSSYLFRGKQYYEKYTDAQIKSLEFWINDMLYQNKINLSDDDRNIDESWFHFSKKACLGGYGLFTHTNVRKDKSDLHPQPEIIEMLKRVYKNNY